MVTIKFYELKTPYGRSARRFAYATSPDKLPYYKDFRWVPATEIQGDGLERVLDRARNRGFVVYRDDRYLPH